MIFFLLNVGILLVLLGIFIGYEWYKHHNPFGSFKDLESFERFVTKQRKRQK